MSIVIDLSTLLFSNKADIVPLLGTAEIINTGIANTLAGNDIITGTSTDNFGILNNSTINTSNSSCGL